MPKQDVPPSFAQLEEMSSWAMLPLNLGKTCELPFREFVLMVQKVGSMGLDWVLYRNDGVTSAREWDIASDDVNIVHNTICAQFPDAEVSLATSARLGPASMHLSGNSEEMTKPAIGAAPLSLSDLAQKGKPSMTGVLRPSQLPALLQNISLGGMTGNLEITATNDTAELYFNEGKIYHCSMRSMEGEHAVVELASWESGDYAFYPDLKHEKNTVRNRLENLLMEGMTLLDHFKGLQDLGMTMEKYVVRTTPGITEQQFEQVVAQGIPADLNFQKSLYQTVDDKTSVIELTRRFPFPKRYWVPVLFSLAHSKLIVFTDAAPGAPQAMADNDSSVTVRAVEPIVIDWQQVRTAERSLMRSDTGILSYPALLLFLEKELDRFENFNRPFSLIILDIMVTKPDGQQLPLNSEGMKNLAHRIEKLKRKSDLVAHFEMFGLAILLPETPYASAKSFLAMMSESLYKAEIVPGVPNENIRLNCGVSGIPDVGKSIEMMLAMAKPRKKK